MRAIVTSVTMRIGLICRCHFDALPLSILLAFLLAACQTAGPQSMSPEEAKQVAATFSGSTFVPPPRTINDITAILDQQKLADPEAAAKAQAKADQRPPSGGSAGALADFYFQRGLAAREIGRTKQEIEDLTQAAKWAEGGGGMNEAEILWNLGLGTASK